MFGTVKDVTDSNVFFPITSLIKSIKMQTVIKISKHLDTNIHDIELINKRIVNYINTSEGIWRGVKRYTH